MDVKLAVIQALKAIPQGINEIWVGYSGGLDSTVLLHALHSALTNESLKLVAIHVHHGLSAYADVWAQHCQQTATAWNIPFYLSQVQAKPLKGFSPEAVARTARYQAFAAYSTAARVFMLSHHTDDQAETLLLQLLRGAGPAGLAAMPLITTFEKGLLMRPLLMLTREQLLTYAQTHQLTWIEDESNTNLNFDRNYLRHQVLPLLRQRWPAAISCINRSAAHSAEAAHLLEEIANSDLLSAYISDENCLDLQMLQDLTPARLNNVLRYWLTQQHFSAPSTIKLETLIQTVILSRFDATPCVSWPGVEVRRFGHKLYAMAPLKKHDPTWEYTWDVQEDLILPADLGVLKAETYQTMAAGAPLVIKFRQGGEKIYNAKLHCHQTLKNKLQEWQVPPWLRDRIPLIYKDDILIVVVGYTNSI